MYGSRRQAMLEVVVENSGHLNVPLEAGGKLHPIVNKRQPMVDSAFEPR
jgi:hypothetical protein